MSQRPRILVPTAVVLSGAAALVYEVVWARQLSVFLGITVRAEAVVLAAFMLGLALGSKVLGTWADRSPRPLLFFAALEASIGVYGLLSTQLLPRLAPWYALVANPDALSTPAGDLTRFLVAGAAMLIPSFLMGGTVPALVRARFRRGRWAGHRESTSRSQRPEASLEFAIGRIYALNTLGAAIGAFAAGFVLLPRLGTVTTVAAAAAANLILALALWATERASPAALETPRSLTTTSRRWSAGPEARPGVAPEPLHKPTALAAFAVFGAAALSLQLGWIQALNQVLGSSVYAFSLTLAAYLAGLAAGGFVFVALMKRAAPTRRRAADRASPGAAAPWIAGASALSVLLGMLAFDSLPGFFLLAFRWNLQHQLGWLAAFSFLLVWCLVLIPTALFGYLSPLIASACSRGQTVSRDVGAAYAANTAGTSLGVLATGYWLLPRVGLQNTLLLGAIGLVGSGCLLYLARRPRPSRPLAKTAFVFLAFALAAASTPRWDPVLTTSGVFINAPRLLDLEPGTSLRDALRERNRVVFYRESAIGSVSVRDVGTDRLLVINGKTDGSRNGDRRTQLALGHLPALLHRDPAQVLVVGFGAGVTPAAVSAHPEVRRLDVIEISPEVVEASRFFAAENRGVLFDARLRLHYADARNYLLASRRTWDVIISEPSNPWISGVANLFTREFFELGRQRLKPDGLMAQWFQSYGMASEDLRSVIGTFSGVFEHVTIWSPQPGDLILVGSRGEHALDERRARRLARLAGGSYDMKAAGWAGFEDFARMLLLDSAAASSFGANAPANTDRHPRVEFNAPRNMYRETTFSNLLELVAHPGGRHAAPESSSGSNSRVVPIRDRRTNRRSAVGLTAGGFDLVAEWRVQWLVLRAAEPTPLPTLAVSLRRAVMPVDGNGDRAAPEIEVLTEAEPPERSRLEERIESLSEGSITGWDEGRLADETPTLRATAAGLDSPVTLAWFCPRREAPFTIYLAEVPYGEVEGFEREFSCESEPDRSHRAQTPGSSPRGR